MKLFRYAFVFACVAVLLPISSARAQAPASDAHIYTVTTFSAVLPEGGRFGERDSLLKVYSEQVTKKNPLVLSQKVMRHFWGHNSHDYVVMSEYKDLASIEAAEKMDNELFEKHWATQEARREFNRLLGKYFAGHSDEIYTAVPDLAK
jgi:hypothetical protein